jgi:uncharacterized glyoxalase superfamily protein PhnB
MTDARAITSTVDVPVDPRTAFVAFTDELDLWWVRGPINFYDSGRAVAMRCEPGVGGRLLEVYDDATDDAKELGRITVWEPGTRLAWTSSHDDVEVEVRFEPSATGTTVRVEARLPADGEDRGGTAWVRVLSWFEHWCERRDTASREPVDLARLGVGVYYARPLAAARWLERVLDLRPIQPLPEGSDPLPEGDHGHPWIELHAGNASVIVFPLDGERASSETRTHVQWVYVDDVEAHFRRAEDEEAAIVEKLNAPWGLPHYVVDDPEGNRWTVAQARPTMR